MFTTKLAITAILHVHGTLFAGAPRAGFNAAHPGNNSSLLVVVVVVVYASGALCPNYAGHSAPYGFPTFGRSAPKSLTHYQLEPIACNFPYVFWHQFAQMRSLAFFIFGSNKKYWPFQFFSKKCASGALCPSNNFTKNSISFFWLLLSAHL